MEEWKLFIGIYNNPNYLYSDIQKYLANSRLIPHCVIVHEILKIKELIMENKYGDWPKIFGIDVQKMMISSSKKAIDYYMNDITIKN